MEQIIRQIFQQQKITLPAEQIKKLSLYGQMVIETNQVMNLTAITEPAEMAEKHFLDGWQLVPILQKMGLSQFKKLIDIGSGAGFPAIPLAIFLPELKITLLESMTKRCDFLTRVVAELNLSQVQVVCNRAEVWGREQRAAYDMVTARAVAKLSVLSEYALPLLKKDGCFFAYKGSKAGDEIAEGTKALSLLGGKVEACYPYALSEPGERCIVVVRKEKDTPEKYPRRVGIPERKPL